MQADWPIFIITLQGDEKRRSRLLAKLEADGLTYRLMMGVDGRKGLPPGMEAAVDRRKAERRMGRPMSDAEFACALSHRQIYETIRIEGLSGAIILEDDAELLPDFFEFLRSGHHRTPTMVLMD